MQVIEPQIAIRAGTPRAGRIDRARVAHSRHTQWLRGAIEILRRVVINIADQTVHVKQRDVGTLEILLDQHLDWRAVLVDVIHGRHFLGHAVADVGEIVRLVLPVLVWTDTAGVREPVKGRELQRRGVHEDEVAGARVVEAGHLLVDAVGVGGQVGAADLAVGEERVVVEVVGADPDTVDGLGRRDVQEGLVGRWVGVGFVCEKGREFVGLNVREVGVDGGEEARGDVVGADGARDCVVVDLDAGVLVDVLWPGTSARGRVVVLFIHQLRPFENSFMILQVGSPILRAGLSHYC